MHHKHWFILKAYNEDYKSHSRLVSTSSRLYHDCHSPELMSENTQVRQDTYIKMHYNECTINIDYYERI